MVCPPKASRLTRRYSPTELTRMAELYFREERRHEFTSEPWDGVSFRHYRDPKIVCLEHYWPPDKPMLPGVGRKPAA
jgi:hypothetical protein